MDRIYMFYKMERYFYKIKLEVISILIRALIRIIFSCDIPYKANIGKGTSFPHDGLGIVIHPNAIVGENCKVLHGVTIGGRSGHEEVPVIGDNVTIGTHAVLLGPIKVGNNATIAAGAVVINDVPDNCVVAGVPAKIIKGITN
ncbi:serine O-acetyltransferase [Bacillus paramycoides]|uniref:serine O-acetyltransferase n=1 Tax=Bacillus paramycoides TaxID=2026194 RepID=UPI002E207AC0|nr:DapH/DapD/GlmU-related protein [Bacillus paramycoides]